jgi:hypothetical protein
MGAGAAELPPPFCLGVRLVGGGAARFPLTVAGVIVYPPVYGDKYVSKHQRKGIPLRIKLLVAGALAVANLAVLASSASATTVYDDTSTVVATNEPLTATNSGSVVFGAGFGDWTCTDSVIRADIDPDGTTDAGDVTSVTYDGCSMNVFGSPAVTTVTAQNLGSWSAALTSSTVSLNDIDIVVVTGSGFGSCTLRVQGSIAGAWANTNSQFNLAAAPGLQVTSVSGGFLCVGISSGDPMDFTGLYDVRTTNGNHMLNVT